jgi:hypothetical protein
MINYCKSTREWSKFFNFYANIISFFKWDKLSRHTISRQKFSRKRENSRHALNFSFKSSIFFNYYTMIRSSLDSISSYCVHKQEYIFYQRELIYEIISNNLTSSKIQRFHEILKSFVRGICNVVVWQYHN